MSDTMSAAIIGLGKWGQTLVNAVQGRSEHIRFVAGTTRTVEKAEAFAERQSFKLMPNLDAVLSCVNIEAVVLATPHSQHLSQIEAAAAAGKNIFCEKPLTLTGIEARQAFAAANAAGVVLAVGHNRRFLPAYQKFAELVRNDIGELRQFIGNFSSGNSNYRQGSWRNLDSESPAGGMTGLGIHMVDAMIGVGLRPSNVTVANRRKAEAGMADTVTALIEDTNGVLAVLTTVLGPGRFWRIEAFGSEGWVAMDSEHRVTFGNAGEVRRTWDFKWTDMERKELEAFAAAVAGGAPYAITPDEAVRGIDLFEAICKAALAAPSGQSSAEVRQD